MQNDEDQASDLSPDTGGIFSAFCNHALRFGLRGSHHGADGNAKLYGKLYCPELEQQRQVAAVFLYAVQQVFR
jgi:hypothetical protein